MKRNFVDEYVVINGIQQYFLHFQGKIEAPVVICVHGGPGSAESIFAYEIEKAWTGDYSMVYYDQRGAGKTFLKNKSALVTMELLQEDLFETVLYIRKKYNKEKIILLGHSFGTVLAILMAKNHPEYVLSYIGMSQVVDWIENETVGYKKLLAAMAQAPDVKDQGKLEKIGDYPDEKYDDSTLKKAISVRRLQQKYKLANSPGLGIMLPLLLKSPIFQISDLTSMMKATQANEKVVGQLWEFSLYKYDTHYEIPVYFIMGENDNTTPVEISSRYLESIQAPDKKLFLIKNAGHLTLLDNPVDYHQAVDEVIQKSGCSTSRASISTVSDRVYPLFLNRLS